VVAARFSGVIWIPTALKSCWMVWTAATQSENPPLLTILKDSGWPDGVWKMPSEPRLNPAFSRIDIALAGLYA